MPSDLGWRSFCRHSLVVRGRIILLFALHSRSTDNWERFCVLRRIGYILLLARLQRGLVLARREFVRFGGCLRLQRYTWMVCRVMGHQRRTFISNGRKIIPKR